MSSLEAKETPAPPSRAGGQLENVASKESITQEEGDKAEKDLNEIQNSGNDASPKGDSSLTTEEVGGVSDGERVKEERGSRRGKVQGVKQLLDGKEG
jgi:hypothetical protein